MWNTRPTQANLSGYKGGEWGLACLQAHPAPPRLSPAFAFDTIAHNLHAVAAFVLQAALCTHYLLESLQGLFQCMACRTASALEWAMPKCIRCEAVSLNIPPVLPKIIR